MLGEEKVHKTDYEAIVLRYVREIGSEDVRRRRLGQDRVQ
jgi:hypothetical protein